MPCQLWPDAPHPRKILELALLPKCAGLVTLSPNWIWNQESWCQATQPRMHQWLFLPLGGMPSIQWYFQDRLAPSTQRTYSAALKRFCVQYSVMNPFPVLHHSRLIKSTAALKAFNFQSHEAANPDEKIQRRQYRKWTRMPLYWGWTRCLESFLSEWAQEPWWGV